MKQHSTHLQTFYNQQADKFSGTRKRPRPEFDHIAEHILQYIETIQPKTITIVELGCWDGRLYSFLWTIVDEYNNKNNTSTTLQYTWVDFAEGLLAIARTNNPDATFVRQDMLEYLYSLPQESVDIFVSVASIQHLPLAEQRSQLFANIYRTLTRQGMHISINRCSSKRFQKKFAWPLMRAKIKRLISLWIYERNTLFVPFVSWSKTYQRLYHIFDGQELEKYSRMHGFVIKLLTYITKEWKKNLTPTDARNSFLVQVKQIEKE